jgi:hypothetical protein
LYRIAHNSIPEQAGIGEYWKEKEKVIFSTTIRPLIGKYKKTRLLDRVLGFGVFGFRDLNTVRNCLSYFSSNPIFN